MHSISNSDGYAKSLFIFIAGLLILVGAMVLASAVQTDFGNVDVSNVRFINFNGIPVRAKLLRPVEKPSSGRFPGIVYIHGYQNNRETGDAYCIELARRGFAVLSIDAIGRGNSGVAIDLTAPDFDETYGGKSALSYLMTLSFVNSQSIGMMGHSLGAGMAYQVALENPVVKALVITGFAYKTDADNTRPNNMLMIIGKYDEFRDRMTGTRDIEKEWMSSAPTKKVIPFSNPKLNVTYGDFNAGTARRVVVPKIIHIQESHNQTAIAESVMWMKQALKPEETFWIDPAHQTWPLKEWATLLAMIAGLFSIMPLATLLLQTVFFKPLREQPSDTYACQGKSYTLYASINGILIWMYLPLILVLFAIHIYVVQIDKAFPMMLVNAIVWWFLWINIIGFFVFRRWFKRNTDRAGITLADLGISYRRESFYLDGSRLLKTGLLALILFGFAYTCEHLLEKIFIVDYRFIFPFASDLTSYRVRMVFLYFPFLLIGFLQTGVFLHGQMRRPSKSSPLRTFASWSAYNILVMLVPIFLFLLIQYLPLFISGSIPFVGPGGMFVIFIQNLLHIMGVLAVVIPISTWLFQLTGKIYLGAFTSAAVVVWMFASSQVIAPIPI